MTDEETISRAVEAALKKVFKKAGKPIFLALDTNRTIDISEGEIWELWIGLVGSPPPGNGLSVCYNILTEPLDTHLLVYDVSDQAGNWHPLTHSYHDHVLGWVQTGDGAGARFDVDTTSNPIAVASSMSTGYLIFGPGQIMNSDWLCHIIMRRRFDLEQET